MVHLDANKAGRRDRAWMPCSARPSRPTPPRAIFAPEVSQKQFQFHLQECKAKFSTTFWMCFYERLRGSASTVRGKAFDQWLQTSFPDVESAPGVLKVLSHFGAVRADRNVPENIWAVYDCSETPYFDTENESNVYVMQELWGLDRLLMVHYNFSNKEKIADIMEAFLGICHLTRHPSNSKRQSCESQIKSWKHPDAVIRDVWRNWNTRDDVHWS